MTMDEKYVENIWNLLKAAIQVLYRYYRYLCISFDIHYQK